MIFTKTPKPLPTAETALPGRPSALPTAHEHFVFNRELKSQIPSGFEEAVLALGCFWGAERVFWQLTGVWLTAVGYAGGITPNPTYEEVCSGGTGHTEVVRVVFDPTKVSYSELLKLFLESHMPNQGMRQGNDIGTQYRSAIYTVSPTQADIAKSMILDYDKALSDAGVSEGITTEVGPLDSFYYAEDYHQQYLAKNPNGYCGIGGSGVTCPMPTAAD